MIRSRVLSAGAVTVLTALAAPAGASAAINAWVVDPAGPRIVRVNTATGASQSISFGGKLKDPRAIAVGTDGHLLVVDTGGFGGVGSLLRIDRDTGAQTTLHSGEPFKGPSGIAQLPNGEVLITDSVKVGLFRTDSAFGMPIKVASSGFMKQPSGVALGPDGGYLVIDSDGPAKETKGSLIHVDPVTAKQSIILGGGNFQQPTALAVRGTDVFVADSDAPTSNGGVYRVPLSAPAFHGVSSSGLFVDPSGIAVEAGGSLLIADRSALDGRGALVRVDAADGRQTVLSNSLLFSNPVAVAVEADSNADGVPDFAESAASGSTPGSSSGSSSGAAPSEEKLPEPVLGKAVNLTGARGEVTVKLPGSRHERQLEQGQQVPVGATVNVTTGSIKLVTAAPGGATQQARFSAGQFKLTQRREGGETELRLVGERPTCGQAISSAKRKRGRRLWGDGHGRFKVRGRNAAAIVRGTKWLVEDRCAGTLVKVTRGKVAVRDHIKRKTVMVKRGDQYFARNAR